MAKKSINNKLISLLKHTIGSSRGFPIFISLVFICVLFVLFRMRSIELDYKISSLEKKIKKAQFESKILKAKKANLLSVKNLNMLASKHGLKEPSQKQIIVIPE